MPSDKPNARITPAELDAFAEIMDRRGITDFAGGDFRITMPRAVHTVGAPMTPITRENRNLGTENDEDDELLYASVAR